MVYIRIARWCTVHTIADQKSWFHCSSLHFTSLHSKFLRPCTSGRFVTDPLCSAADRHRTTVHWSRFYTTAVRFVLSSLVHNCYTWKVTSGHNWHQYPDPQQPGTQVIHCRYLPSGRRTQLVKAGSTQLSFFLFILCRIFLFCLTLHHISSFLTRSVQLTLNF